MSIILSAVFIVFLLFRKIELYSMLWHERVDLAKYKVAAGTYGGPIGIYKLYIFIETFSLPVDNSPSKSNAY